jgi:hypothetical protein
MIVQGVCVDFYSALSSLLLTIGRLAVILNAKQHINETK